MIEFRMPSLGADMEEGTLVAWHKQPGESVRRGETIAEVETDKGVIDIEVFTDGVLEKHVVPEGGRVPVGTVLALIRNDGEPETAAAPAPGQPSPATLPLPPPDVTRVPAPPVAGADRLSMTPAARRLARQAGIDAAAISGSGPAGAITLDDVQRAVAAKAEDATDERRGDAAPTAVASPQREISRESDPAARMRQTIAAAMSRSKREIPHYYLSHTIDLQPALDWISSTNEARPVTDRLLYGVLLLKSVALALREVPELNAVWEASQPVVKSDVHVGVAISLRQGGLIAPALHDTDKKSLDQLMSEFRDLVNRARTGGLRSSELSDSTITVTSLGERGVEAVFGVIYPPQTAIVGFGKVVERPWSIDGKISSRQVVTVTLSADHRVTDGHRGGLFLAAVERLLQEPGKL